MVSRTLVFTLALLPRFVLAEDKILESYRETAGRILGAEACEIRTVDAALDETLRLDVIERAGMGG